MGERVKIAIDPNRQEVLIITDGDPDGVVVDFQDLGELMGKLGDAYERVFGSRWRG